MNPQDVPVLIIIFNRPEKVRELITALGTIKPKTIYVAADGPRSHKPQDAQLCQEARDIATTIPWDCTIHTHYQPTNLGCKRGAVEAVSWFFQEVPEGIILEDDCVPSQSFFIFATELLSRYRDDPSVMHIAGTTFITPEDNANQTNSYWFSNIPILWGWASWRRAWQHYDIEMTGLDSTSAAQKISSAFPYQPFARYWLSHCKHIRDKNVDTWDAQWIYSILMRDGRCVIPNTNLIQNIGFDAAATHTTTTPSHALPIGATLTTLTHPQTTDIDYAPERILMYRGFFTSLKTRLWYFLKAIFN